MDLEKRQAVYKEIEEYRKRPLIVYATTTRGNTRALIAGDVVREFIDQVDAIKDGNGVDILIHSYGGDALAAWKLMAVIRERFGKVGVLVPSMAFSAATIFALGGDEIVMHPHASLGPIDPQIQARLPSGEVKQFAYEDLGAFLKFLREEVQLTEQQHLTAVVDRLFAGIDPVVVGAAKRAGSLAAEVGERLLSLHMKDDHEKAKRIARNLAKSFFAHGDAVSRKRATDLELKIAKEDKKLEALIWQAYLNLEEHMEMRHPFDPVELLLADPAAAAALAPPVPLQLPPGLPEPIVNQIQQFAANQALQRLQGQPVSVPFSMVQSVLESTRLASEVRTTGRLTGSIQGNGEIRVNSVGPAGRWRPVSVSTIESSASAPADGSPVADVLQSVSPPVS